MSPQDFRRARMEPWCEWPAFPPSSRAPLASSPRARRLLAAGLPFVWHLGLLGFLGFLGTGPSARLAHHGHAELRRLLQLPGERLRCAPLPIHGHDAVSGLHLLLWVGGVPRRNRPLADLAQHEEVAGGALRLFSRGLCRLRKLHA